MESPKSQSDTASSAAASKREFYLRFDQKYPEVENLESLDPYQYVWNRANELTIEEAVAILEQSVECHKTDPNFPEADREKIISLLAQNSTEKSVTNLRFDSMDLRAEAAMIDIYSPYPEVRSVTTPYDDPQELCDTPRAYFVGMLWAIVGCGVNSFFEPRLPSIRLGSSLLAILAVVTGKLLAKLPNWSPSIGRVRLNLNPGPWSFKEQMLATIIIYCADGTAYAFSNIMVQKLTVFYGNEWANTGYQILLVLSTQFLGFGLAGIMRRLVVYPVKSMWPTLLPSIALNKALMAPDREESIHGWRISKFKFFAAVFCGSFFYYWLPGYLFTALSTFDWIPWIAPNNFNLNTICGFNNMGINPITSFDWNIVSSGSPLVWPFYAQANNYIGMLLAGAVIIPALYYTNYKWTGYLPINSNALFTNTGERYEVKKVLTNDLFNEEKYQEYSPPYYSAANLLVYGAFFALYPLSIIETIIQHWRLLREMGVDLYRGMRNPNRSNFEGHNDPFCRMMSAYKEVPDWWFLAVLVVSLVLGIICVEIYPTNTPVWGIFFAIGINFVFLIPISLIASMTGFSFGLNVLVELIVGYSLPGNGIALMILKAYGLNIDAQAQNYITGQKVAHYTKLPPRAVFTGQVIGCFFQCFVSVGIANWLISNVEDICTPKQRTMSKFTCPGETTYYSASVVWGVIGPKLVFSGIYPIFKWCLLIGALIPFPIWLLRRKFGRRMQFFQPMIVIGGLLGYAPYSLAYYTPGIYVGFTFMVYIRRNYFAWWEKYNYVLTSSLDAGVALSALIIFFAVQYHPKVLNWWGTTGGSVDSIDYTMPPRLPLPSEGYFGPSPGSYPVR